jgi:hypothetical protein
VLEVSSPQFSLELLYRGGDHEIDRIDPWMRAEKVPAKLAGSIRDRFIDWNPFKQVE